MIVERRQLKPPMPLLLCLQLRRFWGLHLVRINRPLVLETNLAILLPLRTTLEKLIPNVVLRRFGTTLAKGSFGVLQRSVSF